jgi:PAS domain-containing protein
MPPLREPQVITIPSTDSAFRSHVTRILRESAATPGALERRLRRIFPRVIVRERTLSGEPPTWYVYRDGRWLSSQTGEWWQQPEVPRIVVSSDGFIAEASPTAGGLLGIDPERAHLHHFTDFVVPGTLEDAQALFGVIQQGNELTATILVRPISGDVIAVDLHASRDGSSVVGNFRLADDVGDAGEPVEVTRPGSVVTIPATDVAFRAYVLAALDRMPEPTPDGLALRVRRLYPHATIEPAGGEWSVTRDPASADGDERPWWLEADLPRVRYDAMALIVEANDRAREFFGRDLVGHHWQEFVTPGSTEQVSIMLQILSEVGAAESRFRMPRGDGTLIEFDSYTTTEDADFATVFRPVPSRPVATASAAESGSA